VARESNRGVEGCLEGMVGCSAHREAFRDHWRRRPSLEENLYGARQTLDTLEEWGI
jgi:hypothetical protein